MIKRRSQAKKERKKEGEKAHTSLVDEPVVGSNEHAQRQMQKRKGQRWPKKNGKIMQVAREGDGGEGRLWQGGGDCLMNAFLSKLCL